MSDDFPFSIRLATEHDIPALEALIPLSVRNLQAGDYSEAEMNAALGPVFGVDRLLILDGTYFVVEHQGQIIGCGGWSRRKAMFGGDRERAGQDGYLDPQSDPARIRAFFVHPGWARRGIGRRILEASEEACQAAGFQTAELAATLTGVPLYTTFGYAVRQRYSVPLAGGVNLPIVHMAKHFGDASFLRAFEARSITRPNWTHRAHLKIAYLYLQLLPFADALERIRLGIRALNMANGVEDTLTTGYHETMTCAWMKLVHHTMQQSGTAHSAEAYIDEHSLLGNKDALMQFYSKERLMSAEAKVTFIPPDLAPLPET